ncbi:MAG: alanine racemase [Bacilli bacterium]|nr:alanine racemase [Bacilli bacterium]MBN2877853.1 alanine racemase [Bacilli bacterium]
MEIDRCYAKIHLNYILHNYQQVKSLTKAKDVLAVVKADAYGHGAVEVSKMLESHGCKYFAVASLEEAVELRDAGIKGEILIFGRTSLINLHYLKQYNLIQTVHSLSYAEELNDQNANIRIHLNIDTGMSRVGFYLHSTRDIDGVAWDIETIAALKNIQLEGIYTHFADADSSKSDFCETQFNLFEMLLKELENLGIKNLIRHASNSAAAIKHLDKHLDMVRLGIAMYGYPPVPTKLEFKPAMEVFARVHSIHYLASNDTVSYGRTYESEKPEEKIATVAIGYADGYNRMLSNQDYFMIKDDQLPVVGRVCMDFTMVKVEDAAVHDGDFLEIFGLKKDLRGMCKSLDTIPYELLCNISKRVKRIYIK